MSDILFDPSDRQDNGVKVRADGKGDGWANEHREELGHHFYMQDVDCAFGVMGFGHNTADALFLEFVPDDYRNRQKAIRTFGVVGFFDRKSSFGACTSTRNLLSKGVYLHMARCVAHQQSVAPKFFYVVGDNNPPWYMREVDIYTGEWAAPAVEVTSGEWKKVWEQLGLLELRNEISKSLMIHGAP